MPQYWETSIDSFRKSRAPLWGGEGKNAYEDDMSV